MSAVNEEFHLLRDTFVEVFHPANPREFGHITLRTKGLCDGNPGVQWTTWIDLESGIAYLGVNLEGLKYDGWPIARLIERELQAPKLFETIARLQRPDEIELRWRRDAWGVGGNRIRNYKEHQIAPTPIALSNLSPNGWQQALREAQRCLKTRQGGRAKQEITLQDGREVELYVSPHVQFRRRVPWPAPGEELRRAIQSARDHLQPLHDFLTERCA